MPRTNLGTSFETVPPIVPIVGKARIIARNTFQYETGTATVTRLHYTDMPANNDREGA